MFSAQGNPSSPIMHTLTLRARADGSVDIECSANSEPVIINICSSVSAGLAVQMLQKINAIQARVAEQRNRQAIEKGIRRQ